MIIKEKSYLEQVAREYYDRICKVGKTLRKDAALSIIMESLGEDDFKSLILCPPNELKTYPAPPHIKPSLFISGYKYFFSHEGDDNVNNAMWLVKRLNIPVCPYCNRTYTFVVEKRSNTTTRGIRPELDHFFPKPKYGHLALSFYNLVPSCPTCNQLKGTHEFDFHPFYGALNGGRPPKFVVANVNKDGLLFPDKPRLEIENPNENTKSLGLKDLYSQHTDYVKEILDKIQAYNASYYESLMNSFQGAGKSGEEIERLIWGAYLEDLEHTKRPLSKMTKDILEQFDLI